MPIKRPNADVRGRSRDQSKDLPIIRNIAPQLPEVPNRRSDGNPAITINALVKGQSGINFRVPTTHSEHTDADLAIFERPRLG